MGKVIINGQSIFPIGIGTWNIGDDWRTEQEEIKAIQTGLDLGIQMIDTAEMYGQGSSAQNI